MPKVKIIRKGARHPVSVSEQLASHLTKTKKGIWSYAEDTQVSRPKRKTKDKHATGGGAPIPNLSETPTLKKAKGPQAEPEAVDYEQHQTPPRNPNTTHAMTPTPSVTLPPAGDPATVPPEASARPASAEEDAAHKLATLPKGLVMSAKPMTSSAIKPSTGMSRVGVPINSREQLEAMTKADLKALGQKLGVELKPSEPKDEWVKKINRYMRRDMRAVK